MKPRIPIGLTSFFRLSALALRGKIIYAIDCSLIGLIYDNTVMEVDYWTDATSPETEHSRPLILSSKSHTCELYGLIFQNSEF